jgi:3-oxoacyl-[acyl-carrier protein] reductase
MNKPVTLITGTRKGIGRDLVHYFVTQGHAVIGCSRTQVDWVLEGYEHHLADVSDEPAVMKMMHTIRNKHGRLDHLINNAGVTSMNVALLTPMSTVKRVLATNVEGAFLLSREAAKLMMARRWGRIVNMSSVVVALKPSGEVIYTASKAALQSLTEVMARELAPMGITVNALGVAPTDTDMMRGVPRELADAIVQRQAIPRQATIKDIANAIEFFLRSESDFVTGQTLYLGGV